jgi:repressor LexA
MKLTPRQYEILDFIEGHFKENTYAPTLEEIAKAIGIESRSSVHRHVQRLIEAGKLEAASNQNRGISLKKKAIVPTLEDIVKEVDTKSPRSVHRNVQRLMDVIEAEKTEHLSSECEQNMTLLGDEVLASQRPPSLMLVGSIAAGQPIAAIETPEILDLSILLNGGESHFALKVKGDSMIEEGILDGDLVVCRKTNFARDGEIVVALIDQEEATLKRLKRDATGDILLLPANIMHAGMCYPPHRVQIQGVFVG